jgi:hypothetical protein
MKINENKWFRISFLSLICFFSLAGIFFIGTFFAIKFKLTNEKGSVDSKSRYFQDIHDKYNQGFKEILSNDQITHVKTLQRILILNRYYPQNAKYILDAYFASKNEPEVIKMILAADIYLRDNQEYQNDVKSLEKIVSPSITRHQRSVFEWMNIAEWQVFKEAVAKDKKLIDSVGQLTGVEPRLIVSCLVGEQIRLFNSNRESFKKWISPLKILSVETQFSFGVTGIKEHTAIQIESNLKNDLSKFYLGEKYKNMLEFNTNDPATERINRLTNHRNHFYSYLYAALFIKQIKIQWEKAGFPIENRPEILATLFNVGYPQSIPKKNPEVGGSTIRINAKSYSFGSIAFEFYYSGELFELFPIKRKKFDW